MFFSHFRMHKAINASLLKPVSDAANRNERSTSVPTDVPCMRVPFCFFVFTNDLARTQCLAQALSRAFTNTPSRANRRVSSCFVVYNVTVWSQQQSTQNYGPIVQPHFSLCNDKVSLVIHNQRFRLDVSNEYGRLTQIFQQKMKNRVLLAGVMILAIIAIVLSVVVLCKQHKLREDIQRNPWLEQPTK